MQARSSIDKHKTIGGKQHKPASEDAGQYILLPIIFLRMVEKSLFRTYYKCGHTRNIAAMLEHLIIALQQWRKRSTGLSGKRWEEVNV